MPGGTVALNCPFAFRVDRDAYFPLISTFAGPTLPPEPLRIVPQMVAEFTVGDASGTAAERAPRVATSIGSCYWQRFQSANVNTLSAQPLSANAVPAHYVLWETVL